MAGMKNKGNLYPLLGVDFGSQSIKAVAISGKPNNIQITAVASVPTPKGSIVDYQIHDMEKVVNACRNLIKHIGQRPRYIATSVSGSSVISKVIQVDANQSDSDLSNYINSEAEQLIPFPLEEINLDYEVLGDNFVDNQKQDVLISGARTSSVEDRVVIFDTLGMEVKVVDVSVHALARAVKNLIPGFDALCEDKPVGIVDVGAVTLTFGVVYKGEVIYQRLQNFGGDNVTQNLCNAYGLPYDEAERSKIQNRMPADATSEVINPFMTQLAQNIKRNIQLFTSSSTHHDLDVIVLTGGGCLLNGLTEQMVSLLRKDVKCPDIFKQFPRLKDEENPQGYKYMTALGLALRSFEPCPI